MHCCKQFADYKFCYKTLDMIQPQQLGNPNFHLLDVRVGDKGLFPVGNPSKMRLGRPE